MALFELAQLVPAAVVVAVVVRPFRGKPRLRVAQVAQRLTGAVVAVVVEDQL